MALHTLLKKTLPVSLLLTFLALPLSTTLGNLFFTLSGLLALASYPTSYKSLLHNPAAWFFSGMVFLLLAGLFITQANTHEITHTLIKNGKYLIGLFFIPALEDKPLRKQCLTAFLISIGILLLLGLLHFSIGFKLYPYKYSGYMSVKDHTAQGFLFALGIAITAYCAHHSKGCTRYAFLLYAIALVAFQCFISGSRTSYLTVYCLLPTIGYALYAFRGLLTGILLVIGIIVASYYGSPVFQTRSLSPHQSIHESMHQQDQSPAIASRRIMLRDGWALFKKSPWLGVGTGGIRAAYQSHCSPQHPCIQHDNTGTSYLDIMLTAGLIGSAFLLSLIIILCIKTCYLPPAERYLARILLLIMAIGCLFNTMLNDTTESHFFVLLLAFTFAPYCMQNSTRQ